MLISFQLVDFSLLSFFFEASNNNKTGSKTKFVSVATSNVPDVSHPNALVPPKLLPQKIMNPAI